MSTEPSSYFKVPLRTTSPHCSPLTALSSIGFPLPPFSSSSSPDATKPARLSPQGVEQNDSLPPGFAQDVADKLEELLVAVSGLARQGGGGQTLRSLLLHQLVLSLLGL